jgi:hypothetical protein
MGVIVKLVCAGIEENTPGRHRLRRKVRRSVVSRTVRTL